MTLKKQTLKSLSNFLGTGRRRWRGKGSIPASVSTIDARPPKARPDIDPLRDGNKRDRGEEMKEAWSNHGCQVDSCKSPVPVPVKSVLIATRLELASRGDKEHGQR